MCVNNTLKNCNECFENEFQNDNEVIALATKETAKIMTKLMKLKRTKTCCKAKKYILFT